MTNPRSEHRANDVLMSDTLAGLSYALDLTEGQRPGHAVRSCLIGLRLAEVIGLSREERSSLFYALLMKDLGCSSNAARFAALFAADDHRLKADLKTIDWTHALAAFRFVAAGVAPGHAWPRRVWQALAVLARGPEGPREVVRTRCERGADIARMLRFTDDTVQAIRTIDEHWDGHGQPYGLKGDATLLLGRVVGLAQTLEVYVSTYGVRTAYDMAVARRGRWFDPALVDALRTIRVDDVFWRELQLGNALGQLALVEPADSIVSADEDYLDVVAEAFARVIDAKSPWTYQHSNGVAEIAAAISANLGFDAGSIREIRRAALLHDLGKLGVSNLILDKPGRLTDDEMTIVKRHPGHTHQILQRVGCFRHLADMASSHHERLDGKGYHRGIGVESLSTPARILCAADICDALRATRPYRAGLPADRILEIMGREVGSAIDGDCFEALRLVLLEPAAARTEAPGAPGVVEAPVPEVQRVTALAEDYEQAA